MMVRGERKPLVIDNAFTRELIGEIHRLFMLHTEQFTITTSPTSITIQITPEKGERFLTDVIAKTGFSHGNWTTKVTKL